MNMLSEDIIETQLKKRNRELDVFVFDSIDSTNNEAKRHWKKNRKAPCLFVSDEQTGGRGRRGRSFYSPKGTGLYMSLLLHPEMGMEDSVHITTATAVIVARVLREMTNADIGIKWVNDLYLNGRKICGILTEAVLEPECNIAPAIVVGIGINLSTEMFPDEIQDVAGGLGTLGEAIDVNSLTARITEGLLDFSQNMKDCSYINDYRKMSIVLGKEIRYTDKDALISARALDVDSEGGLIVELQNGSIKTLKSGEISVRLNIQ